MFRQNVRMTGAMKDTMMQTILAASMVLTLVTGSTVLPPTALSAENVLQEGAYAETVFPLLNRYCFECHAGDVTEADIDLAGFRTMDDVRKNVDLWIRVRRMLDSRQMPPKESKQLTDDEYRQVQQWVHGYLADEAKAHAGDPGEVVLRRLSNAEYTYTIRDLTGLSQIDPAREFPVDGAAGEGFTNTGSGLVMSPSLVQKYLTAARQLAEHAALFPDGIRFSEHTSRRDLTDQLLADIQQFYRRFTEDGGGTAINLQGIQFDTNQGGLLPVKKYLAATLEERNALSGGQKTVQQVADERMLNRRYLQTLWTALTASDSGASLLMQMLRRRWQQTDPSDAAALAAEIDEAQRMLWKFHPVGQIGRPGGPVRWMEATSPLTERQQLRLSIPDTVAAPDAAAPDAPGPDVTIVLAAHDAGDGNAADFVVWEETRFEFRPVEGRAAEPSIRLLDVSLLVPQIRTTMAAELPRTKLYLKAVADLRSKSVSVEEAAAAAGLNPGLLQRWAALAGVGSRVVPEVRGHFTNRLTAVQGYETVNGWGDNGTPSLLTNRAAEDVSFLTLTVPARGVTVHPSPTREAIVTWKSPLNLNVRISALVADADNKCGNGAMWRIEVVSQQGTAVISDGVIDNGGRESVTPEAELRLQQGDLVRLVVNPRDANHSCDTTHVELTMSEVGGEQRVWDLATDVVDQILEGNPLPDRYSHINTWHFGARPSDATSLTPATEVIPGSLLAAWRAAVVEDSSAEETGRVAQLVQDLLTASDAAGQSAADRQLRQRLLDWRGPLRWVDCSRSAAVDVDTSIGIDPAAFGRHPQGADLASGHLCLQAPQLLEMRIPAALVAGADFVTTATMHPETGAQGTVQVQVLSSRPTDIPWSFASPILTGTQAGPRVAAAMTDFQQLFPEALCYARIVPVDEVVTLTLFHREDDHLKRLMLDDAQAAELDRLWDELYYVSQEPLKLVVALEQITEFATQDRPDLVTAFAPMKKPVEDRAAAFQQRLRETESVHLHSVLALADRAWRRPLTAAQKNSISELYVHLRDSELPHEDAIRLVIARILTSPAFLYRQETPSPGTGQSGVSDAELASRLSYFLWSSMPDAELRAAADAGLLTGDSADGELLRQTHRLLRHPRTRRMAIHFACQWLHLRNFDQNDDKNERLYPEFAALRGDMYEETVRFFEDMFRHDGSILDLLNADHTFLNPALARHYGIEGVDSENWQRVEGVQRHQRGGILAMATVLASQSGASRTSPILRGNWISETLLGERLPRPPPDIPQLPETVPTGLTARQLIERHSSDAACAHCHERIDPFGFALEQYDAIGRLRAETADTETTLVDGTRIDGMDGLRQYLAGQRKQDVVRQFCRKLLGYALGREIQLSDEPLLDEMLERLQSRDFRFHVAVECIVSSRQFLDIRDLSFSARK
ncbi:MAG: DUF1592 domain-containing protein [Fuerstiella sp.]